MSNLQGCSTDGLRSTISNVWDKCTQLVQITGHLSRSYMIHKSQRTFCSSWVKLKSSLRSIMKSTNSSLCTLIRTVHMNGVNAGSFPDSHCSPTNNNLKWEWGKKDQTRSVISRLSTTSTKLSSSICANMERCSSAWENQRMSSCLKNGPDTTHQSWSQAT